MRWSTCDSSFSKCLVAVFRSSCLSFLILVFTRASLLLIKRQIVAFVSPEDLDLEALSQEASKVLSAPLMPSLFAALPSLPRLPNGKADLVRLKVFALDALANRRSETYSMADSLGVLQNLSKCQVQEDRWMQNQQAFWTLLVMLQHFSHTCQGGLHSAGDFGHTYWSLLGTFCHGRDMIAFILLLGFTDARNAPVFGWRDTSVLLTAAVMSACFWRMCSDRFYIGAEWFLYTYLWARLLLVCLSLVSLPGVWQAGLMLLAACLWPDDLLWLQLSVEQRVALQHRVCGIDSKGLRFCLLFMPACYLFSFHAARSGVFTWCKGRGLLWMNQAVHGLSSYMEPERAQGALKISFSVACWTFFFAITLLTGYVHIPGLMGYQFGFQATYVEVGQDDFGSSHAVTWEYITHPSLLSYVSLWMGEALLFILPGISVALALMYFPWHFKQMGGACFGIFCIHVTVAFSPTFCQDQQKVMKLITNPSMDPKLNISLLFLWNLSMCILFALTVGITFHRSLVYALQSLAILAKTLNTRSV